MPIIKSAKKRVKVASRANARNNRTKRSLRDALKAFSAAVEGGKSAEIAKTQAQVMSAIDIAAKKDVIHRNKAARSKAQISARAKAAGAKPMKKAVSQKPKAKGTTKPKTTPKKAPTSKLKSKK